MTESYPCEWDGENQLSVSEDPDGYVELIVGPVPYGDECPGYYEVVRLTPETARHLARAVTLTTFRLEGEEMSDAVPEPCPDTNKPCGKDCPLRRACHDSALEDVHRASLTDGSAPPVRYATPHRTTAADRFRAARDLAGPAADLDAVFRVADYLKGNAQ
ncbi:hypothetical protein [Streptomyces sp. NPDC045470]|uniref:hypothetical protein n=1 Tax=Streptomyces sp. NPDC045470 TaxID=3155469 RepID=UPI0033E69241